MHRPDLPHVQTTPLMSTIENEHDEHEDSSSSKSSYEHAYDQTNVDFMLPMIIRLYVRAVRVAGGTDGNASNTN
jgi:hypothetical protein